MLLPIRQLLSQEEATKIKTVLEGAPWLDGKQTAGAQAAQVKANQQLDETTTVYAETSQRIAQAVSTNPTFISAALPKQLFPPKFNCYQDHGCYGLHVDSAIMYLKAGNAMRTDMSATLFLSDSSEYEGGELVIETRFGMQSVKLDAGDLILYPSSSLHQVMPVTRGKRISSFFWIESMVRNSEQREILFDLDQSIQSLSQKAPGSEGEVNQLSAIYHNLVRQWSIC